MNTSFSQAHIPKPSFARDSLVSAEMALVDREIQTRLQSDVALINQLGAYIINSGGKRLRPIIVLLAARAFNYKGPHHITLATVIEFIHTATLLHDDVVDGSEMRRGQSSANVLWGNEASVLVGDFLYSRAFEMMVEVRDMHIMEILANTTNTIAEGEVMQLMNCHDPDTTEERYIEVIQSKTAKLFAAAACLGPVLAGETRALEETMASYGMHLGTAFQLIDDTLDYVQDNEDLGKNTGDDLAEGKPTLPLIHALNNGNDHQRALIRRAIKEGGRDQIEDVLVVIESTNSIAYTVQRAETEAQLAREVIAVLPESPYKSILIELTYFSVNRSY